MVMECPGATRVEVEDRGAGYREVMIYGKENVPLGRRSVFPLAFKPPAP